MTAKRESLLVAIEEALTTGTDAIEVIVDPAGDPSSFPALCIVDGGQRVAEGQGEVGQTRYIMAVIVEGYVEGGTNAAARSSLNDLYLQTVAALLVDPPLGGLADRLDERDLRIDVAELASKRRLAFALSIEIEFSARRESPSNP